MKPERLLRDAHLRYGSPRVGRGPVNPSREEYRAAMRWLACARDALVWARESSGQRQSRALARACEALVLAEKHRASARRWRQNEHEKADDCAAADEDARFESGARVRSEIVAFYAAARHALAMARVFRSEPETSGRREGEVVREVGRYREAIRKLRQTAMREERVSGPGAGPGLKKGLPEVAQAPLRTRAS